MLWWLPYRNRSRRGKVGPNIEHNRLLLVKSWVKIPRDLWSISRYAVFLREQFKPERNMGELSSYSLPETMPIVWTFFGPRKRNKRWRPRKSLWIFTQELHNEKKQLSAQYLGQRVLHFDLILVDLGVPQQQGNPKTNGFLRDSL